MLLIRKVFPASERSVINKHQMCGCFVVTIGLSPLCFFLTARSFFSKHTNLYKQLNSETFFLFPSFVVLPLVSLVVRLDCQVLSKSILTKEIQQLG